MAAGSFDAKPTEVKVTGHKTVTFFDERFVKAINENVSGAVFGHYCLWVPFKDDEGNEKFEHVTIGHDRPSDEKRDLMAVTADKPETLEKVIKGLKTYFAK